MFALLAANGVNPEAVWNMTYGEAADVANAIETRTKAEMEMQAALAWKNAELIGQFVARMLVKGARTPQTMYQAFPWIRREEEIVDWRTLRARVQARADAINKGVG